MLIPEKKKGEEKGVRTLYSVALLVFSTGRVGKERHKAPMLYYTRLMVRKKCG